VTSNFDTYSRYYDLLYQDKDYQGEADYIHTLLSRFSQSNDSVLELGCGTGKHGELLATKGLRVTGVERSLSMLDQATKRSERFNSAGAGRFTAAMGDARDFRCDQIFDSVISLFHVMSYQTSSADVNSMFQTAASHLRTGGLFVFDVWYGPAVLSLQPAVRVKRMEDSSLHVTRIAEPTLIENLNRVDVTYTVFTTDKATQTIESFTELHPMRYFFAPELESFAQANGFDVVHQEEWLSSEVPSRHSWGVVYVCKKSP
jgi:SAM-dependent methyltransferase